MRETVDTPVDVGAVPDRLAERDQWVCWREEERDGKSTKVPIRPGAGKFASTTDPNTWAGFEVAVEFAQEDDASGIGFVFSDDDPFVGVDLDDCRDTETGDLGGTARDIVERLDSYTEVSPSGTGLHVIVEGDLPNGRNRRESVELYDSARFFTVTGDHVEETPTRIARRQDAIEGVHRDYVQADEPEDGSSGDGSGSASWTESKTVDVDLEDVEVVRKAKEAENGEKFQQLWNGNTAGYDSHSEADMALCCLLAFWTGGDQSQMDRLFRQSGLMREKWDEVHYAEGSTYGEVTIDRAISTVTEYYDPDATYDPDPATPLSPGASPDSPQNPAYLAERNRLLEGRVEELQATVEEKNDRIEELEDELRRYREERK